MFKVEIDLEVMPDEMDQVIGLLADDEALALVRVAKFIVDWSLQFAAGEAVPEITYTDQKTGRQYGRVSIRKLPDAG